MLTNNGRWQADAAREGLPLCRRAAALTGIGVRIMTDAQMRFRPSGHWQYVQSHGVRVGHILMNANVLRNYMQSNVHYSSKIQIN